MPAADTTPKNEHPQRPLGTIIAGVLHIFCGSLTITVWPMVAFVTSSTAAMILSVILKAMNMSTALVGLGAFLSWGVVAALVPVGIVRILVGVFLLLPFRLPAAVPLLIGALGLLLSIVMLDLPSFVASAVLIGVWLRPSTRQWVATPTET